MNDDNTMPACEIPLFKPTTKEISDILALANTIAIVGISLKEDRDSNKVAKYLIEAGYDIIPVNPKHGEILGLKSYPTLSEIPQKIDIVDIFRRLDAVPGIVDEAIKTGAKVVWMQENIVHNESARTAKNAGLKVIMNKCIMKEHRKWEEERA
jgi:predicted CoA-binding protein